VLRSPASTGVSQLSAARPNHSAIASYEPEFAGQLGGEAGLSADLEPCEPFLAASSARRTVAEIMQHKAPDCQPG